MSRLSSLGALSLATSLSCLLCLLGCELSAPALERSLGASEVEGPSTKEHVNSSPSAVARLSPWHPLSLEQARSLELLRSLTAQSEQLPRVTAELPLSAQLCIALGPELPPTIAWAGSRSPALSVPIPPHHAEALLILMVDWDAPKPSLWPALNETWRSTSAIPNAQIERRPLLLWGALLSRASLKALERPPQPEQPRLIIPEALGGQGWPLLGAPKAGLSPLAYQAKNDYSAWFKGSPLAGPQLGYTGPCVPSRDPSPHQVTALMFALKRSPDLPSEGSEALSAWELWARAAPLATSLSRFDWRAQLLHDPKGSLAPSLAP